MTKFFSRRLRRDESTSAGLALNFKSLELCDEFRQCAPGAFTSHTKSVALIKACTLTSSLFSLRFVGCKKLKG